MTAKKSIIAIVDDEPVNRLILKRSFYDTDYICREYEDGESFLSSLDEETPDLVLLDIMMPGLNGFDVCKSLKNNPKAFDVPIIIITALSDKESKIKGLELGAYDVITKPFDIFEVQLRVKQYLIMRELFLKVRRYNDIMKKEILAARKLQLSMLPESVIEINDSLTFINEYYPCDDLGGDFLDFIPLNDEFSLFFIADVSGHGVASALITVFLKDFFNQNQTLFLHTIDPAYLLSELNNAFIALNFQDKYLTMFVAFINHKTNEVLWSSAGPNTMPLLITEDSITELKNEAIAIGWWPDVKFDSYSVVLPENSMLLCYSDAVIEAKNPQNKFLNVDGLKTILKSIDLLRYEDLQIIIQSLLDYTGQVSFNDDLSLMAIKRK